jgi:serine/threonine-protein kinase
LEPFQIGDVVAGKYEITRVLGQGGMGVVMAARHRELGELVALKFLRATSTESAESRARFAREARTASRIKNEHVARVYDAGTVDGVPFIVMEHLVGEDLARVLRRRGPLPGAEAVDLLLQACEAIAEAHNLGIVHRDLKPANLFVTTASDGTPFVKVLDFGISKSTSAVDASVTATAALLGSPLYMSPEQLASSRTVDARADVWSLGVILYELVAGRTPFAGESFATLAAAILRGTYAPVSELRADVPAPLEEAIAAALARESAGRPTVAAFAARIAPSGSEAARASCQRIERIAARLPPAPEPGEEGASGATVPEGPPSEVARAMEAKGEVTQPPALERSVAASVVAPARRPLSRVVKLALAVGGAGLVGGAAVVGWQQTSSVPLAASDPGAVGHTQVSPVDDAGAPDADDAAATSPASAGDGGGQAIQITDGRNPLGDFAVATWPDREHPGGVIDALAFAPYGTDGAITLAAIDLESRRIIARNPIGNYTAESIVKIARTQRGVVVAHQRASDFQLQWYTDGTIDADQHSLPQLAAKPAGRMRALTVLDDRIVVATGGGSTTTVWILDDKGTLKTSHACHGGVYSEGDAELVRMGDDVIVSNFTTEEPDRVPVCAGRLHGAPRWREVILHNGDLQLHGGRVYFSRFGGADHAAVNALDENLKPTGLPPPPEHAPVGRTPCEGVTGMMRHVEEVGERAVVSTFACCGDTGGGLFVCGPSKQGG